MKSVVLSTILLLAPSLVQGSGGHGSLLEYRRLHNGHHARHAAMAAQSTSEFRRFRYVRKSAALQPRKTSIGTGDSETQPDNLAKGSSTKSDGCTVWHTASAGEVCLGLIDKTPGWTVADFYKYNPSVNSDCSNLTTGLAYCVTVQADGVATSKEVASSGRTALVDKQPSPAAADAPTDDDDDDDEDCEDDEEEAADDEEEDCDDEDDTAVSVSVKASDNSKTAEIDAPKAEPEETQNQAPKAQPAPQEKKQESAPAPVPEQEKPAAPQPEVKPTSTYVEPPKETPAEPKPQAPAAGGAGTGGGKLWEGQGTFYYQNGNAGSCGTKNPDSALIVAIKSDVYNSGVKCGDKVHLTNTKTGATADAVVADLCPTCVGSGDGSGIDLSTGLFQALAGGGDWQSMGVVPLKYSFSG